MRLRNLHKYFSCPTSARQKQYEAVRAIAVEKKSYENTAKRFGYKISTLYSIIREVKAGRRTLFPNVEKGPRERRTSQKIRNKIVKYRRRDNLSTPDIQDRLKKEGADISTSTVERILKDAGFQRLKRRSYKERGVTPKHKVIPSRSEHLDFDALEPFTLDCPMAGVYFFLPYIIDSGIIDIVKKCRLPKSSVIGHQQACLSMLLLKLIGNERLSNMDQYDHEPGLGLFAGLNVLPKATYMNTYSCRTSEQMQLQFQEAVLKTFMLTSKNLYGGPFINLDFHSIPHYGEQSEMEKVWCGSRGKRMKGANTVFAQDSKNNMILYTRADILGKEESLEIKNFVAYWKRLKKQVAETLVFDCRFTKYTILDELSTEGITFITLRKRNKKLTEQALAIPKNQWQKRKLLIPKRKYTTVSVFEHDITLPKCSNTFRQIIVKDHGRLQPTFIITNNNKLSHTKILEVYAKRWRIENKLSELVSFFNLNALSSPLMIRIHFDILWTFIADSLYRIFSQDLRRFEKHTARSLFKKFITMPGKVVYNGDNFQIKIRKRAYTPILKSVPRLQGPFKVPWLGNRTIEIIWTA